MPFHIDMDIFRWSAEKNETLVRERGISFEEVVQRIADGAKIIETDHPNQEKYPNQKILIVDELKIRDRPRFSFIKFERPTPNIQLRTPNESIILIRQIRSMPIPCISRENRAMR